MKSDVNNENTMDRYIAMKLNQLTHRSGAYRCKDLSNICATTGIKLQTCFHNLYGEHSMLHRNNS